MLRLLTRSLLFPIAACVFAEIAPAQLVEGLPSNDYVPGEWYPNVYQSLGRSLAGVRLGGDKPRDLIAAGVTRNGSGRVVLLAPRSRRVVMELGGDVGGEFFGESLASSGSTLLIGESIALQGRGRVRVVDVDRPAGARWLDGFEGAERFGLELLAVPDASSASFVALIAAPTTPGADDARGVVALYREARGEPVWIQRAVPGEVGFGRTLVALGDVDGDGTRDFAVSSLRGSHGAVALISGESGVRLREWIDDAAGDRFGTGLAGIGDIDGDGVGDLAIGIPWRECADGTAGRVRLVSTASGKPIREIESECRTRGCFGADAEFGAVLASIVGTPAVAPELFIAAPRGAYAGADAGFVEAWSCNGSERHARFAWDYCGFRPERFGGTLASCVLDLDGPTNVLLVGGRGDNGGGLHVRRPGTNTLVWEIFGCHLEPPR
ncbi:MAG: hypothetical protein IT453_22075 [Planctomycetes bacterium]|nr:hypothetical protein [Planctomycetota bacterium]